MFDSPVGLCLLLAAGALLLAPRRRQALALVGVVAAGLAVAAFHVRPGPGGLRSLALRAAESSVPLEFMRINTALLLAGVGFAVSAAVLARVRDRDRGAGTTVASLVILFASSALVIALLPLLGAVGWAGTLGIAAALALVIVVLGVLGRLLRLAAACDWLDRVLLERAPPPLFPATDSTFDIAWLAGLMVAAVAMCVAPSLRALTLATMIAATVGHVMMRQRGGGTVIPVAPLLAAFTIPVFTYLTAITGSSNPLVAALPGAPLSTAAEIRLVPWIALAAWGFAGLWPLHGVVIGLAAPLSGVLLIRLASRPMPDGVEHWAPLFMPVILLGLWHAAATLGVPLVRRRRIETLLVAVALFGIAAGGDGAVGGTWFLAAAALYPWIPVSRLCAPSVPLGIGRLIRLPLVWAGIIVLTAGLAVQITYTVLAAAGIAAAIWSEGKVDRYSGVIPPQGSPPPSR